MIIQRDLKYRGLKGNNTFNTLFDSGATLSCIHPEKAAQLAVPQKLTESYLIGTASEGTFLEISEYVFLEFDLEGHRLMDAFFLIPNLNAEVVIGVDTLQKYYCQLDFKTGDVIVDPNAGKLMLM